MFRDCSFPKMTVAFAFTHPMADAASNLQAHAKVLLSFP